MTLEIETRQDPAAAQPGTSGAQPGTSVAQPGESWLDGALLGFDTETTGVDVDSDRIVTAALVLRAGDGQLTVRTWLIDPGVEIPRAATDVHGITTEHARAHGSAPADALAEIAEALAEHLAAGAPIVAFNVSFDLTILDAELRRHGLPTLVQRLGRAIHPVLDPLVIDRGVDRYRKGKRTLTHLCDHYGIVNDGQLHTADIDVVATLAVLAAQCERYPQLRTQTLAELHDWQAASHRAWAENFQAYLQRIGRTDAEIDHDWPYRGANAN